MKSRISIFAMFLLVVVVTLVGWTTQARSSARTAWEYRVVVSAPYLVKTEMNTLGADGWELVSILPDTVDGNSRGASFYFKRPK
jgi:hypothetical protein